MFCVCRVASALNLTLYEVPTGWKYFGNIMDHYERQGAPLGVLCGVCVDFFVFFFFIKWFFHFTFTSCYFIGREFWNGFFAYSRERWLVGCCKKSLMISFIHIICRVDVLNSVYVFEKLAWLSIMAVHNSNSNAPLVSLESILQSHWQRFGRNYFSRFKTL